MARALAMLGTGSDVGKSLLAAGFCRLLFRSGVRVAPFKAQNMSLNSYVTPDGGEMGRAQVLQAQACGLAPHVDMNPILLKPETQSRSQVIVQGKVWSRQEAKEYFGNTVALFEFVQASYERLAAQYDVIVIEGAGSAAELNLRNRDIVNWPVVELADASVVLVADIDRGGVFAQVIGTMDLLMPEERRRVIGIVINKFRGDLQLFQDGVRMIEARTHVPVLGVLPFVRPLELDQEDSLDVERFRMTPFTGCTVNVVIVLVSHMSNFTDFNQLAGESDVALRYAEATQDIHGADVVILPGSKTTIADMDSLKTAGFHDALMAHVHGGGEVVGICGGFQMLGQEIVDPEEVETCGTTQGFGLLEVTTQLLSVKTTRQVQAHSLLPGLASECHVQGYEIHMGRTMGNTIRPCFHIRSSYETSFSSVSVFPSDKEAQDGMMDGMMTENGRVWGTYIHGVFDQPRFRRLWLNRVRARKGLPDLDVGVSEAVSARFSGALDTWADHVARYIDCQRIYSALGL